MATTAAAIAALSLGCALLAPSPKKAGGITAAGDTVRIGMVASFSGTSAGYGSAVKQAAEMAVERVNAAGGVLGGRKLGLESRDDQSDRDPAVKAATELYDSGVAAIIGTNASSSTQDVLTKVAKPRGAILISPSATSPALTLELDGGGWFFRTVPNDTLQGKVVANILKAAKHTAVSVIHLDSGYGQGFANKLKQELEAGGGRATLVPYEETSEPKSTYADVVGKALDTSPQAIVLIGYPGEASVMLNDWQLGGKAREVVWYFGDGVQDQSFVTNVTNRGVLEGRTGTAPYSDPAFIAAFEQKYGKKPPFDATAAYDAVMLLALAIEAGKSPAALAIKGNLKAVSTGGEKFRPENIGEALAAARQGKDVDYDGYAGPVDLDDRGDVTSGAYEVWQIKDGKIAATGRVERP